MPKSGLGVSALVALLLPASLLAEIKIGSTYADVIQEKGQPASKVDAGKNQILHYGDSTLKLRNGVVSSIHDSAKPSAAPAASVAAAAAPARAVVSPAAAPNESVTWQTNYAAAMEQAKAGNRRVFLFFTGSDWCGWCKRLQREILTTPEFAQYSREKLVLVELDFPKRRALSAAQRAQNAELAKRYQIEGYPTVIVLDAHGKKVGELGYQEGGPGPFLAALGKL